MVKGWIRLRKFLKLKQGKWDLPGTMTVWQFQLLQQRYGGGVPYDTRVVHPLLKKLGFGVLMHMRTDNGWIDLAEHLRAQGLNISEQQRREIQALQSQLRRVEIGTQRLQQSKSWKWEGMERTWKGWKQKKSFWRKLITREESHEELSDKWPTSQYNLTWKQRWQFLWEKGGTVQPLWRSIRRRAELTNTTVHLQHNLLSTIDEALQRRKEGGTLTYILAAAAQSIWEDRNHQYFQNQRQRTPAKTVLQNARRELEASMQRRSSTAIWDRGKRALQELQNLIEAREEYPTSSTAKFLCL
ncbi:hypothetical protein R1sor_000334 [Riccia sorocarpa]|uniref:Uncharacterized protein n=1 Tax=Riccia sorocarpa TaxID=122646 RepID=A0ABD3GVV8_9MARC